MNSFELGMVKKPTQAEVCQERSIYVTEMVMANTFFWRLLPALQRTRHSYFRITLSPTFSKVLVVLTAVHLCLSEAHRATTNRLILPTSALVLQNFQIINTSTSNQTHHRSATMAGHRNRRRHRRPAIVESDSSSDSEGGGVRLADHPPHGRSGYDNPYRVFDTSNPASDGEETSNTEGGGVAILQSPFKDTGDVKEGPKESAEKILKRPADAPLPPKKDSALEIMKNRAISKSIQIAGKREMLTILQLASHYQHEPPTELPLQPRSSTPLPNSLAR